MNEILISHASYSEVLARVSYQCLIYYWRHTTDEPGGAIEVMEECSTWLRTEGFSELGFWVSAYRFEWTPMTPARFLRGGFIFRARQGSTWRSVAYPAYKKARRDPRVTNRGVTRRASKKRD